MYVCIYIYIYIFNIQTTGNNMMYQYYDDIVLRNMLLTFK